MNGPSPTQSLAAHAAATVQPKVPYTRDRERLRVEDSSFANRVFGILRL